MKNKEEFVIETGQHDGENVSPFCFSLRKRITGQKKSSPMTKLAFTVDLLFCPMFKYARFIFNFMPMRSRVLASALI